MSFCEVETPATPETLETFQEQNNHALNNNIPFPGKESAYGLAVEAMVSTTCSAMAAATTISSLTFGTKFTAYSAPR